MSEMKIRGRRKHGEPSRNGFNQPRSRGRPMKPASELRTKKSRLNLAVRLDSQHRHIPSTQKLANTSVLSHLERLPMELIQQIFFHTLELNLAQTSHTLHAALSRDSIYRALILFAFFDEDDRNLPVETKTFLPAEYRPLNVEEKVRLQISILKCNWCSLSRLKEYMPALSRLKMVQAWHAEQKLHHSLTKDGTAQVFSSLLGSREYLAHLPNLEDTDSLEQHFFAKTNMLEVFVSAANGNEMIDDTRRISENPYRAWIFTWSMNKGLDSRAALGPGFSADEQVIHKIPEKAFSILGVRHIPNRFLCGEPWTPEKLEMLQLLRQGHRFIRTDFVLSISYPAMFKGMASAIKEYNLDALKTLLELHNAVSARSGLECHTRYEVESRNEHFYAVPFETPIPLELFHLAVQTLPPAFSSQEIDVHTADLIVLLLREGIDSVPLDDPILTRWAVRNDHLVAKWLLNHMETRQDYGVFSRNDTMFDNGALNSGLSPTRFPFPQTSFTQELGYETFGALNFLARNPQG